MPTIPKLDAVLPPFTSLTVKEFVITQLEQDLFKITYVSSETLTELQKKDIYKAVETYLESGLRLEFEKVTELKRSKSGKLKQFTSLV